MDKGQVMPTRSGELSTEEVAERLELRVETVPNIIRFGSQQWPAARGAGKLDARVTLQGVAAKATVSRSVCNAWDHAETR
jgi:hypothetical protein